MKTVMMISLMLEIMIEPKRNVLLITIVTSDDDSNYKDIDKKDHWQKLAVSIVWY